LKNCTPSLGTNPVQLHMARVDSPQVQVSCTDALVPPLLLLEHDASKPKTHASPMSTRPSFDPFTMSRA
jgi:hypothetical protein